MIAYKIWAQIEYRDDKTDETIDDLAEPVCLGTFDREKDARDVLEALEMQSEGVRV